MGYDHEAPSQPESDSSASEPAPTSHETARQIRAYQQQLRRLASELSLAEARERREIASDLHEHIGQALAYVSQRVSRLQGNAVFSGMENDFGEILSILNQAIRYTRDLTVAISPPILYELGLPPAIDWLAEKALHRHGLKVSSVQSGDPHEVADDISVFIFKSVQELITNVAKHAQADRVTVNTIWGPEIIEIRVADNGRGFDGASFASGLSTEGCFGLFSIRERLSYVGGRIEVESEPGKGTCVTIFTPYRAITEDERG
jgi:signal transduction histidine kinase